MQANSPTQRLVDLAKAYSLTEFYPLTHPTLTQAIFKLGESLMLSGEPLQVRVLTNGLAVGSALGPRSAHVERLAQRLQEHGVETLVLGKDIGSESLARLLSALALPGRVVRSGGGLVAALSAAGAGRLAVNGEWVQPAPVPVAAGGLDEVEDGDEDADTAPAGGIELWSQHEMYEQVRLSSLRVETEDTEELRRLLRESESEGLEVLGRLEFLAQYCLTHGMMDRAVALVNDLRRDAEEMRGRNPAKRSMIMLAIHRLSNRALIEELAERLGKARGEEERTALRSTLQHIGADTVTSLVRALTAATDAGARRAYRDALVSLDQVGVPLMEDMVGDDRWFVVRNMVGILGDARSADAIEHFRRTIDHQDARVRRETIGALAKVGGEEAVPLLVKGLNDRDASLRGAAALGLGLTKLASGVGPLLARLPQESDPEVELEMVRAFGRIGDARAVPVLAERASGGGFFSRVPANIRLEAVRALGEIQGEAARAVLQRLLRDRNPEVRDAAAKALG